MYPGINLRKQVVAAYTWRLTEEGGMLRERKKTRVSCKEFRTTMEESLLRHHMEIDHRIVMPQTQGLDVGRGGTEIYMVLFPRVLKSVACPVDGCLER